MTKRIVCTILALVFCFSLAVSVSAASAGTAFVIDEIGYLTDDEVTALNRLGAAYYDACGVGIFFVYTQADSLRDYDVEAVVNGITDYVLMVENESSWYVHVGGVGAFMDAAALYFPAMPAATVAAETAPVEAEQFVYDEADLLTDEQETALEQKLAQISHGCDAQIVIVTVASMDGGDIDTYVDYLYDSMGIGYGEDHDGVLLLVSMDPREYRIVSNGYAGVAIGPEQIDTLCDVVVFYLSKGNYATAFTLFANECEEYLAYHQAGSPFNFGKNLAISLIIGLIVGVIVAFVMKGQLKSVRKQDGARVYVKKNSMKLSYSRDIFLYRNVTRTKKQERVESSSSGSGGTTRSKGGGSF